jgi:hypothetical protein
VHPISLRNRCSSAFAGSEIEPGVSTCCADAVRGNPVSSSASRITVVVVAASTGSPASANVNVLSGRSAMPVPNARMPKPSHTQLTSGLTTTCNVMACVAGSREVMTR